MNPLPRALQCFRPDAPRIAGTFVLMLLAAAANALKPWPLAIIVDSVLGSKPLPDWFESPARALGFPEGAGDGSLLLLLAGAILVLHAGQGALALAHTAVSIRIGLRGLTRIRTEVFARLQQLSIRQQQKHTTGDLIHRAAWDIYSFQTLFQQGAVSLAGSAISLVVMLGLMWRTDLGLTLAMLAVMPMLVAAMVGYGRRMTERSQEANRADSEVTSRIQESLAALPLIQSYTLEPAALRQFREQAAGAEVSRQAQHRAELFYRFAISLVFAVAVAGLTWLGARKVAAGQLTIGELLVFLAYLGQLYEPLNQLSHVGSTCSSALAGVRRVFELLDAPDDVPEDPQARPVRIRHALGRESLPPSSSATASCRVEFDQVTFGYDRGQPVLAEVSFVVEPGQTVAIIGPSGVGKTTLLCLLPRFFDPDRGAVRLGGLDLRSMRLNDVRSASSLVLQQPLLLPATVEENIVCGRPGSSRADIESAARAASADAFIRRLTAGYDTVVGEGGARLSVGEVQRLNLARAFLKDAPLLLLDEPTSALDAESESLLLQGLRELRRGRTTLIVAHRLSTIQDVDRVIAIVNGRIEEVGSPDELRAREGYYARILRGQAGLE